MKTPKFYTCVFCNERTSDGHYCSKADEWQTKNPEMFACCRPCERCGKPLFIPKPKFELKLDTYEHGCGMQINFTETAEENMQKELRTRFA